MRRIRAACIVFAVLVLVPSVASAQATITGVVKDTSGAVLPGVTVEAASPILIERVRSTVTDAVRSVPHRRSPHWLVPRSRSRCQDSPPSSARASS